MGIMKRRLFGLTSGIMLVFVVVLLNSCATIDINIEPEYAKMVSSSSGNERVIDQIVIEGRVWENEGGCPSRRFRLGEKYQLSKIFDKPERHKHEFLMDKLLDGAEALYPNDAIEIRNASVEYKQIGARDAKLWNSDGHYETHRFDKCQDYYVADIVTAGPIPEPVTYSVELSLADVSRADLYTRIANWLADEKYVEDDTVAGVRLETDLASGVDLERIKGDYIFYLTSGQKNYVVTSNFTIDVHDDKAEMSFKNTRLQWERGGNEEQIFLQSIANAAQAELVSFSEKLKNSVAR
jgi:hypothetical protein